MPKKHSLTNKLMIMSPAYIFDAFGTLFDLQAPMQALENLTDGRAVQLLTDWRRQQLEYTWLQTLMGQYQSFDKLTNAALAYVQREMGLNNRRITDMLLPIYESATIFPDVLAGLQALKNQGATLAILSNATPQMLHNGVEKNKLADCIDYVISADELRIYKPDPRLYNYALNRLNRFEDEVVFVSSNQWDVAGAVAFGLPTLWLNRTATRPSPLLATTQPIITNLSALCQ